MPDQNEQTVNLSDVSTPRLDEYFGLWSIEPTRGLAMFDRARKMDLLNHVESTTTPRPSAGIKSFRVVNTAVSPVAFDDDSLDGGSTDDDSVDAEQTPTGAGIAVLMVCGTLMKQQSSLDTSTSTVVFRKQCRDIAANARYQGAIICFDTPGGSVAGTAEAAQAIKDLAAVKPVIGQAQDLCASAGMWLASQCDELYANHGTALVGSIGTFIGTYDYSKWAENEGIQAKVYATGPLKGAGFPGAKITPEQDAYFQNIVDQTQRYFTQAVADGRGMSVESVSKLATGGVFMASEAIDNGLLDGIKTFDECVARMGELIAARNANPTRGATAAIGKETTMSSETKTPATGAGTAAPANAAEKTVDTKAELKRYTDAFGMANGAQWYMEGKTFEEATALHTAAQAAETKKLQDENAKLKAENDQLHARVKDLRGANESVDAGITPEKKGGTARDANTLESKIGPRLASVARAVQLPKSSKN
jgi:signal peptide peptidase SppA